MSDAHQARRRAHVGDGLEPPQLTEELIDAPRGQRAACGITELRLARGVGEWVARLALRLRHAMTEHATVREGDRHVREALREALARRLLRVHDHADLWHEGLRVRAPH